VSEGSEKLLTQEETDENIRQLHDRLKVLQNACDALYAELADLEDRGLKDSEQYKEKESELAMAEENLAMFGDLLW